MNTTTRYLDGRRDRRVKEESRAIREKIYDLAVSGEEFTVYTVLDALHLDHGHDTVSHVNVNLRSARLAGFIEQVERRTITVNQTTPQAWIAGGDLGRRLMWVFRGTAQMQSNRK